MMATLFVRGGEELEHAIYCTSLAVTLSPFSSEPTGLGTSQTGRSPQQTRTRKYLDLADSIPPSSSP
jgi:hypothetical protein